MLKSEQADGKSKPGTGQEGRGSRRAVKKEEHVRAIMTAANQLLDEVGYEAMTMDDVAVRSGLSKPTLYQYFRSKQELWMNAVIERIQKGHRFMAELDANLPGIEKLEKSIAHFFSICYKDGFSSVGPAMYCSVLPTLRANPDYKRASGQMFSILSDFVDEARAQGAVAATIPTRIAAQVIISLLRDKEYIELINTGEFQPERLAQTLVRIYLYGITPNNLNPTPSDSAKSNAPTN